MNEKACAVANELPRVVAAADWSTDEKKRWMVRAERIDSGAYVVYPPEPMTHGAGSENICRRSSGIVG